MSRTPNHALSRRVTAALLALAALALGPTACGDDEAADASTSSTTADPAGTGDGGDTEDDVSDPLDDTTFSSTEVRGRELVEGSTVRLAFEEGQLSASAGCNTLGGGYTLDGDRLVIEGEMRATQMACDEPLMDQDTWLSAWLVDGPAWQLDGSTLTLTGAEVTMVLSAEESGSGTVEGSWRLDTVITGDMASSVPADVETPTLEITGDQMQVFAGCNRGGSTVQITDTTITFEPVRLTRMACPESATALEASVVAVLDGDVPYQLEGELLTLGDAAGLVWRRVS